MSRATLTLTDTPEGLQAQAVFELDSLRSRLNRAPDLTAAEAAAYALLDTTTFPWAVQITHPQETPHHPV